MARLGPFANPSVRLPENTPKPRTSYDNWRENPTPANLRKIVEEYRPIIQSILNRLVPNASPIVKRRADLMAAKAIASYDPSVGMSLKNYLAIQLKPVSRVSRKIHQVIPKSEYDVELRTALSRAEEELTHELGREPTVSELSDHTGISEKRQEALRKRSIRPLSESALLDRETQSPSGISESPVSSRDPRDEWLDYVYHSLDEGPDRVIFEARTGYRGRPMRSNLEVAKSLGLSPGAISQRAGRIQSRIDEFESL